MRLNWSDVRLRTYETGIDHGVLYPQSNPGVPWNGLVSVTENVSGGETEGLYYDGSKFKDDVAVEGFQATLSALSAPVEFGTCDGTHALGVGLYAMNQPRGQFGLSYRTRIGSYLKGTGNAYKLHLVYNATASPSSRSSKTLGEDVDTTVLQWTINTIPPPSSTYKPTAHIVFDSRKTDPTEMKLLEDRLYGTSSSRPYLPAQEEVFRIITGQVKPEDPIGSSLDDNRLTMTETGMIQRNGKNFRSGGFNAFQLITNDYPQSRIMSHDDIDRILQKAVALNAFVIRAHTLAASVGNTATLVKGTIGDGNDVKIIYDPEVWEAIEYAVAKASELGIYLIAPFVDELGYYHGGKRNWVNFRHPGSVSMEYHIKAANSAEQRKNENVFYTDPQIQIDFHRYISDWLNHVNRYTGRQFKNEPALSIVQIGNELWTAAQDAPGWIATQAAFIKSISPKTLVMDAGTDGLAIELMAWDSPNIDILETHPYTEFKSTDVIQMSKFAASKGKAFSIGEYAWAKPTAAGMEQVARDQGNIFFSAPWSLQNDEDLHNQGSPYGTSDDNSFYVPGKDDVNRAAVDRLRNHGAAMIASAPTAVPPDIPKQGLDTFTGANGDPWNPDLWRIDIPRPAQGQPSFGNYAEIYNNKGRLHVAPIGGYDGNAYVIVSSRAPLDEDQELRFTLSANDPRPEAYFRAALRSKFFGPSVARRTCYFLQMGSNGTGSTYVDIGAMVDGVETFFPGGSVPLPDWGGTGRVAFNFSIIGSQLTLIADGKLVKMVTATSVVGPGYTGFDLRGGAAKQDIFYEVDDWYLT